MRAQGEAHRAAQGMTERRPASPCAWQGTPEASCTSPPRTLAELLGVAEVRVNIA